MAKITFRNLPNEESEFKYIDEDYLISLVYEFARSVDDEIYKQIMSEKITIRVNGEVIHPDKWLDYKINKEDKIIVTPAIEGEDAGFLQILIGVALLFIAGPLAAPLALTAETSAMIAAMGASMILGGISSLLFKPDLPIPPAYVGTEETQTYSWSGIKTMSRTDTPIPVIYGTHMVGGNLISVFTDRYGTDDYLHMLIALGEGEIEGICTATNYNHVCTTSLPSNANYKEPAIFIDDQLIFRYDDVEWWYRTGTNATDAAKNEYDPSAQNRIPYFDAARVQFDDGRDITASPGITYTTTKEVDMVTVQVRAPALFDSSDGIRGTSLTYNIFFRSSGAGTWTKFNATEWEPQTNSSTKMILEYKNSDSIIGNAKPKTYTIEIISIINSDKTWIVAYVGGYGAWRYEYDIKVKITHSDTGIIEYKTIKRAITSGWVLVRKYYGYSQIANVLYPLVTYATCQDLIVGQYKIRFLKQYIWDPDSDFDMWYSGAVDDWYSPTDIREGDIYTIYSTAVSSDITNIPISGLSKTGLWSSAVLDFNYLSGASGKGVYDIRVQRTDTGKSTTMQLENNIILNSVVETVQGKFIYPNTALLGLRIKATDQLSGAPPNILTLVKGKKIAVPDLEDTSPSGTDVTFQDCFWDSTNNKWVDGNNATVYWNNTSSWRTEYSSNPMLCVRDLIIADRYGLGEYLTATDLNDSGIKTVIKEAHVQYAPTDPDQLSWWDDGDVDTFDSHVVGTSKGTINIDSTNEKISFSGDWSYQLDLNFGSKLIQGQEYQFSMVASDLTASIDTEIALDIGDDNTYKVATLVKKSDGTHTHNFITPQAGIDKMKLTFQESVATAAWSGKITDISLTNTTAKSMHYHSFDGVLESEQSAVAVLLEMCDSFRTWPVWHSGTFNFIYDSDSTPIHTITVSNTNKFSQTFTPISEIPYRVIGQFTDEDNRYNMRSLIAKSTSTTLTKSNEKTIGLKGITNRKRAERELIWKLNKATNCTHIARVKCGLDMIHATAGDIVYVQNDLPSWGTGGRVLDASINDKTITLSNPVTIASVSATYVIRYQTNDNDFVTATLNTGGLSNGDELKTITINAWPATYPTNDAVYAVGKSSTYTKKFRLLSTERTSEDEIEAVGVEHLSSLYTSEPTITVIEDRITDLPNPFARPNPPINVSVNVLDANEGRGFVFNAEPPLGNFNITEIEVKMKKSTDAANSYYTVALISPSIGWGKYINNNLELDVTYDFRFTCKTQYKVSEPVDVIILLPSTIYQLTPPTGLRIQGEYPNSDTFEGKAVTIEWNPIGSQTTGGLQADGYLVEVYHTSIAQENFLRASFVNTEQFTYSVDDCIQDSGAIYGTQNTKFIFIVYSRSANNILSTGSLPLQAYNTRPTNISGLSSTSIVGGVQFSWTKSKVDDHKNYEYKIKVGAGTWGSTSNLEDNGYAYTLSDSNISTYGRRAEVTIGVKDVDWYGQKSATFVQTTASANVVSDSIFQMTITKTGGTGTASSLYDGVLSSGGVTIT